MKPMFIETAVAMAALTAANTFAAPPATSAYGKATSEVFVQDAASDGLSSVNMVMCIMNAMSPSDMLTQKGTANAKGEKEVQYIALVDKNKCDKKGSSSSSSSSGSGSDSAPNWITATVNITRASNSSPMLGKIWMKLNNDDGKAINVYVATTVTKSPTDAPPYGTVHIDYAGYEASTSTSMFKGFVDANGGDVTHVESGTQSSNTKLALTATSTTAGSGIMRTFDNSNGGAQIDLKFAYNSDYFARNSSSIGGSDICFNRDKAQADKSVWRYGTYDATTGDVIDQTNPGFPLKGTYSGNSTWGFASYWGINFGNIPQTEMAKLADGEVTVVTDITDQRPGKTDTYKLFKNSGRLVKYTAQQASLSDLDGVQINLWGDGCKLINGPVNGQNSATATPTNSYKTTSATCIANNNVTPTDYNNWVIQWDKTLADPAGAAGKGNFKLVGVQYCGSSGCSTSTFTNAIPLKSRFANQPLSAWSNSMGPINIPLATGNTVGGGNNNTALHQNSDPIYYFTQSVVVPSSSTLNLQCLSNCPTAADIAAMTSNPTVSPFKSGTTTQSGAGTSVVSYTFGTTGLLDGTQTAVVTTSLPKSGMWQNGLSSGRLFDSNDADSSLVTGANCYLAGGSCEPSNPKNYYQYQTGPQIWNNTFWLTKAGTVVSFDAPVNISYAVPATPVNQYSGKTVQMQFNGFGNIGIPGQCVNVSDNTRTDDCSGAGKRYVPAFALDDGAAVTIGGKSALVKALNAELRLKKETCTASMPATTGVNLSLPTSSPVDPSLSASSNYIGTQPTVTSAPAVIHGVIQ